MSRPNQDGHQKSLNQLPHDVEYSLAAYMKAELVFSEGGRYWVAVDCWNACERLAFWLAQTFQPGVQTTSHRERITILIDRLGLEVVQAEQLRALARSRQLDGYGNTVAGRERRTIRVGQVEQALEITRTIFTEVAELLDPVNRRILLNAISVAPNRSTTRRLFEMVERSVVLGHLSATIDSQLDALERQFLQPISPHELPLAVWVAELLANRAMQRGRYTGPNGSLALSKHAIELCGESGDAVRRGHLYNIQAISFRRLHNFKSGMRATQLALAAAERSKTLTNIIRNQEALLLSQHGVHAKAVEQAGKLLDEAQAWGDPDLIRRRSLTVGQTLLQADRVSEAEPYLEQSRGGEIHDHVFGQCYSALAHMRFAELAKLDTVSHYATVVKRLAEPRRLVWHQRRADLALRRFAGLPVTNRPEENNVF